jgi:hypothetical protein
MAIDRRHIHGLLARSGRRDSPKRARHGRYKPERCGRAQAKHLPRLSLPRWRRMCHYRASTSSFPVSPRRSAFRTSVVVGTCTVYSNCPRHSQATSHPCRTRPSPADGAAHYTRSTVRLSRPRPVPSSALLGPPRSRPRCLRAVAHPWSSRPSAHTPRRTPPFTAPAVAPRPRRRDRHPPRVPRALAYTTHGPCRVPRRTRLTLSRAACRPAASSRPYRSIRRMAGTGKRDGARARQMRSASREPVADRAIRMPPCRTGPKRTRSMMTTMTTMATARGRTIAPLRHRQRSLAADADGAHTGLATRGDTSAASASSASPAHPACRHTSTHIPVTNVSPWPPQHSLD